MWKKLLLASSISFLFSSALPPVPASAGGGGACMAKTMYIDHNSNDANNAVVGMTRSCFTPTLLRVEPGTEVTFHNKDPYPHAVHGANNLWQVGEPIEGGTYVRHSFQEPGIYLYSCYRHPGMTGAIIVGEDAPVDLAQPTLVQGQVSKMSVTKGKRNDPTLPVLTVASYVVLAGLAFLVGRLSLRRR